MKINIDTTKLKADLAETIADTLVNVDEVWAVIERFVIEHIELEEAALSFYKGMPHVVIWVGKQVASVKVVLDEDANDYSFEDAQNELPIVEKLIADLTSFRDGLKLVPEDDA